MLQALIIRLWLVSFRSHYTRQLGFTYYLMQLNFSLNGESNFRVFKSSITLKFLLSHLLGRLELSDRIQAPYDNYSEISSFFLKFFPYVNPIRLTAIQSFDRTMFWISKVCWGSVFSLQCWKKPHGANNILA